MTWWDDLWLNEAFATWMGTRIVQKVDPTLQAELQRIAGTAYLMRLDSQASTRAIRQPIEHGGDIENAFDGITYGKGAAVLRMIEAWLGREQFREGVRAYLRKHAYGSATTADLFNALESSSNQPVGDTIRLFLEQPGTPLVSMAVTCQAGAKPLSVSLRAGRSLHAVPQSRGNPGRSRYVYVTVSVTRFIAGARYSPARREVWNWTTLAVRPGFTAMPTRMDIISGLSKESTWSV